MAINTKDWTPDHWFQWSKANLEGAIKLAGQTIQSLIIINGGAAIGVMTFFGNVLAKCCATAQLNKGTLLHGLMCFGFGVAFAAASSIFAYVSQRIVTTGSKHEMPTFYAGFGFGLLSVACFIGGLMYSAVSFEKLS